MKKMHFLKGIMSSHFFDIRSQSIKGLRFHATHSFAHDTYTLRQFNNSEALGIIASPNQDVDIIPSLYSFFLCIILFGE